MTRVQSRASLAAVLICFALVPAALADTLVVAQRRDVAEPPGWALGLQVGTPTGINLKRYLGTNAFDLYLGGVYGPGLRFGADYLFGIAQLANEPALNLDFYVGGGGFVGTLRGPCESIHNWQGSCDGDGYLGARMPIGVEMVFKRAPLALALELAPGIAFAPGRAGLLVDAVLALRLLL